ncbi:MAG TPA: alpha/beta fold hydrolase [Kofleriaceae bacterium]
MQAAYLVSDDLGSSLAERWFTTPRRYARPARESALLASATPFSVSVSLRSPHAHGSRVSVAAWRWGHGPTALLVHGWEGRGSQLASFVEPLVRAGMSVVAFDAPAHGDSPGSRLYLTDLADAVIDVASAIGPVHAILAHSFGCAAVLLAHARGGVDAPRNVMVAPNAVVDDSVAHFASALGLDAIDRAALESEIAAHAGVPLASLRLDLLAAGRDAGLLILHDRDDREVPVRQAERLAAVWPQAQIHITDGLGHRRILRDPSALSLGAAFAAHGLRPPASPLVREVDRLLAPDWP